MTIQAHGRTIFDRAELEEAVVVNDLNEVPEAYRSEARPIVEVE